MLVQQTLLGPYNQGMLGVCLELGLQSLYVLCMVSYFLVKEKLECLSGIALQNINRRYSLCVSLNFMMASAGINRLERMNEGTASWTHLNFR